MDVQDLSTARFLRAGSAVTADSCYDLEDVADAESDAGLDARDQLIVARRVVEQRSHEDLTTTTHTHTPV